ncbi:MAG: type 4a pilus biogenesis protein PilO [Bacillota bacterium]
MAGKRNSKDILVFALVGVVLLSLALLSFRQVRALSDVKARVAEEQVLLSQTRAILEKMREAEKQAVQLESQRMLLDRLLPGEPKEDELMLQLQLWADLADMQLMQVRFGDRVKKEGYLEMPVQITLEGKYHQMLVWLGHAESSERAVRIDEIKVGAARAGPPEMLFTVRASAFYAGR